MDLRSILSGSENGHAAAHKPQPPPPHQQQHPGLQQQQQPPPQGTPTTPAQSAPPYSFRDYGHGPQASPSRHGPPPPHTPQDYGPQPPPQQQQPPPGYAVASPYQAPGPYGPRHAPPPLQPTPYADPRSPGGAPMPAPSPYRQTPTSAVTGPAGGYPFPPTPMPPQEATSPVQRHQHPPPNAYGPRDSYSQAPPGPPAPGATGPPHGAPAYPPQHQQHPMPQTPPVGNAAGPHSYMHQRSQSTHSTPTPTSAQSQHQYGPPYVQGSPVAAAHPLPTEFGNRQPSQPPTPLGPPLSAGPRPSAPGSFAQPPSPHLQRVSSSASSNHHPAAAQASPPPPPPPTLPLSRMSSGHAYDPLAAESHRRSQSQSERDRSVSVSPKTRVPSIHSAAILRKGSIIEHDPRAMPPTLAMPTEPERLVTPAKRKLDDRDLRPDELEKRDPRPPPAEVNGNRGGPHRLQRASTSPVLQRRKRTRYSEPPVWAQDFADHRKLGRSENFVLQSHRPPSVNGKPDSSTQGRPSRHASPETTRSIPTNAPSEPSKPESLLGPWEPTMTGVKPAEEIARRVADWLFLNVVNNPSAGEIQSRGIQFEIEAKLGTLIDKQSNARVERWVDSECLLKSTGSVAFRSSMTDAQHEGLNEFLNSIVVDTNPMNPKSKGTRVQVHYLRRREVDRYFELPHHLQDRLPACVRNLIPSKHSVKARVTYDMVTKQPLAKIVKARVTDIDLHLPQCPLDCRISVNLEMNWEGPVQELEALGDKAIPDRRKDRLCYTQGHYQVDLTQVIQTAPVTGQKEPRTDKEHELEIELSAAAVIEQGRRAAAGEPHLYPELIEGFIDNIRLLARRAPRVD